ncbi:hypothetical protein ACFOD0_15250 [Shewanella intestini]|uniref:Lipoprotein n=1 Tax=Shewanella intestini TaxID=2017544 RepID=A0ABS5I5R4_9GAMM|nr:MULTISPECIES: hypothetical protein [Shewanella]MBR9729367.1 hypothetical protein [Shewanella intestini]MRG37446.1 hypothetical protein [Shewanella sp. XMDDZSB0408]
MKTQVSIFIIIILLIAGCQSTYKPKLTQLEKQQKKMMLRVAPKAEFTKYIDIMFIKSCEELYKYIEPRGITVVSAKSNQILIRLPSGQTTEISINNLECQQ